MLLVKLKVKSIVELKNDEILSMHIWKVRESGGGIRFGELLSVVQKNHNVEFQFDITEGTNGVIQCFSVTKIEGLSILVSNYCVDSISFDKNCYLGGVNLIGERFDDIRLLFGVDDFVLDEEYELNVFHQIYSTDFSAAMVFCENGVVVSLSASG